MSNRSGPETGHNRCICSHRGWSGCNDFLSHIYTVSGPETGHNRCICSHRGWLGLYVKIQIVVGTVYCISLLPGAAGDDPVGGEPRVRDLHPHTRLTTQGQREHQRYRPT